MRTAVDEREIAAQDAAVLVEITFRGSPDPAILGRLRGDGWSVLASTGRAAIVADDLADARRRFADSTSLDPDHVLWRSPHRRGVVPSPQPPSAPVSPPRVVRRRLPRT